MSQCTIRMLADPDFEMLSNLFNLIVKSGENKIFHPHVFTDEMARIICSNNKLDAYFGAFNQSSIVGYGMLRGWDEGYDAPALGIYVTKEYRGTGLSRNLMQHLHDYAMYRQAKSVILKVYGENCKAVSLYKSLGYRFESEKDGQLCARFNIKSENLESL